MEKCILEIVMTVAESTNHLPSTNEKTKMGMTGTMTSQYRFSSSAEADMEISLIHNSI